MYSVVMPELIEHRYDVLIKESHLKFVKWNRSVIACCGHNEFLFMQAAMYVNFEVRCVWKCNDVQKILV